MPEDSAEDDDSSESAEETILDGPDYQTKPISAPTDEVGQCTYDGSEALQLQNDGLFETDDPLDAANGHGIDPEPLPPVEGGTKNVPSDDENDPDSLEATN